MPDQTPTQNLNVEGFDPLVSPGELTEELPLTDAARRTVIEGRRQIERILSGEDDRLLAVVGPCSVHDVDAAAEYAGRLKTLADDVAGRVLVVMRVYFEKPRTTTGWKGLINDPFLYSSREFDIETGLRVARRLLLRVAELGLPAGTEFLDPFTPQYLDDLVSWAAVGARTTESQTHRQMASGLSMPVGFKNATTGDVQVALDAMRAAKSPHPLPGPRRAGAGRRSSTRAGNRFGHVILRGGHERTNYHPADVADAAARLSSAGLGPRLMVDCSHANSGKRFERQEVAWHSVLKARQGGDRSVIGLMLESNLEEGRQDLPDDAIGRGGLRYGVSVTDACVGWDDTARLLREAAGG